MYRLSSTHRGRVGICGTCRDNPSFLDEQWRQLRRDIHGARRMRDATKIMVKVSLLSFGSMGVFLVAGLIS